MAVLIAACGSDGAGPQLSPEAAAGREISRTNGCAACHGSDGGGSVGPPFAGLYGSEVALADGTTVVADDAYLAEAIREPDAKIADGYELSMPPNDLSDDEIASVIAYIRGLSAATTDSSP
jgi:cytochrome c oxidase subunit 2